MFVHSPPKKDANLKEGKVKDGPLLALSVWKVAGGNNAHMLRVEDWSGK